MLRRNLHVRNAIHALEQRRTEQRQRSGRESETSVTATAGEMYQPLSWSELQLERCRL